MCFRLKLACVKDIKKMGKRKDCPKKLLIKKNNVKKIN